MKNTIKNSPIEIIAKNLENQGLFNANEEHNNLSKIILMNKNLYSNEVFDAAVQINMSYFSKSRSTRISINEVNLVKKAVNG